MMDNILQRMLAVDQEADKIIAEANAQAEAIAIACRRQISEENSAFEGIVNAECDAKLQAAKEGLEQRKSNILSEAQKKAESQQKEFAQKIRPVLPKLVQTLLHPQAI